MGIMYQDYEEEEIMNPPAITFRIADVLESIRTTCDDEQWTDEQKMQYIMEIVDMWSWVLKMRKHIQRKPHSVTGAVKPSDLFADEL